VRRRLYIAVAEEMVASAAAAAEVGFVDPDENYSKLGLPVLQHLGEKGLESY